MSDDPLEEMVQHVPQTAEVPGADKSDHATAMVVPDAQVLSQGDADALLQSKFEELEGAGIGEQVDDTRLWGEQHSTVEQSAVDTEKINEDIRSLFSDGRPASDDPNAGLYPATTESSPEPAPTEPTGEQSPQPPTPATADEATRVEHARRLLSKMQVPAERVAKMEPKEILDLEALMKPYHTHTQSVIQQNALARRQEPRQPGQTTPGEPDALTSASPSSDDPSHPGQLDELLTRIDKDFDAETAEVLKPLVETVRTQQAQLEALRGTATESLMAAQIQQLEADGYDLSSPEMSRLVRDKAEGLAAGGKYAGRPRECFKDAALLAFGGPPSTRAVAPSPTSRDRDNGQPGLRTNPQGIRSNWATLKPDQRAYRLFSALEDGQEIKALME